MHGDLPRPLDQARARQGFYFGNEKRAIEALNSYEGIWPNSHQWIESCRVLVEVVSDQHGLNVFRCQRVCSSSLIA